MRGLLGASAKRFLAAREGSALVSRALPGQRSSCVGKQTVSCVVRSLGLWRAGDGAGCVDRADNRCVRCRPIRPEPAVLAAALQEQIKLSNPPGSFGMGHAVAIEGDTAVVGAPLIALNGIQRGRVFVYTRTSGSWQLQQILQRDVSLGFGDSVDVPRETR